MYLNKQGEGKIDWCDYTWNPIGGKCLYECEYCYMAGIRRRFPNNEKINAEPFLDEKVLNTTFPEKPSIIFVCSANDMFGDWIPEEWVDQVFELTRQYPKHTFMMLTKNPKRYLRFFTSQYQNVWLGITYDGFKQTTGNISILNKKAWVNPLFVSFEPLFAVSENLDLSGIDWVILGADSRLKKVPEKILNAGRQVIELARAEEIPVWVKDNFKGLEMIKEMPPELQNIRDMARLSRAVDPCSSPAGVVIGQT